MLATTLFAYGLLIRLLPFAFGPQAYLQRYPSEDGYFMLMFARNIARGLGMSSAAGTMPTNGTQPLMTLLWSPAYMLVNGDRALGVALVLVMELGIALAAWVAMRLL